MERIKAKEGMYLTQAKEVEDRVFAKSICLCKGDKAENWRDATPDEKERYKAEQEAKQKAEYEKWKDENTNK